MASFLMVEEYSHLEEDASGYVIAPAVPLTVQKITVGSTSTAGSAFNAATRFVVLASDVACHFEIGGIGSSVTATTSSRYQPANLPRAIVVRGSNQHIAVIETS